MSWTNDEFEKLRVRDTRAVEKLYELYKDKLYNFFLLKSSGDRDLACELLSETFFSVLNSIDSLKNSSNIQGWVFQIAIRRYNDHLRRAYRSVGSEPISDFSCNLSDHAERAVLEDEKIAMLYVALDKLKPVYKEILTLKYFQQNSEKEIACSIGKSVGAIEGLLYRARQALKKELGHNTDLFMEGP